MTHGLRRCADAEMRRALAEEIAELGIEIICREEAVVLRGDVETESRRDAVVAAVARHFPGYAIHNDIFVLEAQAPAERERL